MKVLLIDLDKIKTIELPSQIFGNYWITDNKNLNLTIIDAINGKWVLKSNLDYTILFNNEEVNQIVLLDYNFYTIKNVLNGKTYSLYCCPIYDTSYLQFELKDNNTNSIIIGNNNSPKPETNYPNNISFNSQLIGYNQVQLQRINDKWAIVNLNNKLQVFVNNRIINKEFLNSGDVIFINGLKISVIDNIFLINNPNNLMNYDDSIFNLRKLPVNQYIPNLLDNIESIELYEKSDYFLRPPRFKSKLETVKIKIDPPPAKQNAEETPAIYTIGPMFIMGISSLTTGIFTGIKVLNGEQTLYSALPSLIITVAMLFGMLLLPVMSKAYESNKKRKKEKKRIKKYSEYIENNKKHIKNTVEEQTKVLIENSPSLVDCGNIILNKKRNLWERKIDHEDFLELRIGIGSKDAAINIEYPEEHFTLEEDEMMDILQDLAKQSKEMKNVPVVFPFAESIVSAIIGNPIFTKQFIDGLILQMITYHGYDNLKIVIFTDDENKSYWEKYKNIPYCWDDEKKIRFYGTNSEEITQISNYLEELLYNRTNKEKNEESKEIEYKSFKTYYLILTDSYDSIRSVGIINQVLEQEKNAGFSIIVNSKTINNLPTKCSSFINVEKETGGVFENELASDNKFIFKPEFPTFDIEKCLLKISNIPIDFAEGKFLLPQSLTFLEMYNVGNVNQLNSFNRWKENNPTQTLQAPVGIGENGELFSLDLHEKSHGPHGLIAGMTGSGKSEFIITYILSMAVNYHPNEVNFVLIDYKGGGLAGAFENREKNIRLPHLTGTITNLDVVEMNRSLASIQSELKRRQKLFNDAKNILSESTIDIYKYQQLYREGKLKEPLPHLFIISDEFAELKEQQPDFMQQLISTARIGRSLGVHLVLATQKPSGVVDNQIWSNSKFRVCLKVQEKSDSMDMIKTPDAAAIKEVGRFFLQVGYNEFFAMGQSAWCGSPYYETEKRKETIDNSIVFVNNVGSPIKSIKKEKKTTTGNFKGEELPNILNYLINLANSQKITTRKLWLDSIPEFIFVNKLKDKYSFTKTDFEVNPVIGEYDDPSEQNQGLLTLPLYKEGNTLIYGVTGSGKELLLTTIIYSSIVTYGSKEVNIYILDFGSETLKCFKKAPHIGDIITSEEKEKVNNLFKMINRIVEERKELFNDYNGNYLTYCKQSGNTVPFIVIIINNIDAFQELYPDYEEVLIQLTREAFKFGICFIITTSSSNNIRYKLSQNFKQHLVLQQNDEYEYTSILGRTDKKIPSKFVGRGLIKLDKICEFQTAYPYEKSSMTEYIKIVSEKLNNINREKAEKIPVLPKIVTKKFVSDKLTGIDSIPIGVEKNSLKIRTVNLKKQVVTIISAQDITSSTSFIKALIGEISNIANTTVYNIDTQDLISKKIEKDYYINSNFDDIIKKTHKYTMDLYNLYQNDKTSVESYPSIICSITGINKFYTSLSEDGKKLFEEILAKAKEFEKIRFIFIDSIEEIKNNQYNPWFKDSTNDSYGIWYGNGVNDQFTIKISNPPRSMYDTIDEGFGYDIVKGVPTLIKFISNDEESNEGDE